MSAREKVAEQIFNATERAFPDAFPWSKLTAPEQSDFLRLADAAIAAHLEALKADGYAVIKLPEVAHKGPHDTDAEFFRLVADRMDDPTRRIDYLSGGNVRNAVRQLLYRAADAMEAQP